jgi:hypothetical protein
MLHNFCLFRTENFRIYSIQYTRTLKEIVEQEKYSNMKYK